MVTAKDILKNKEVVVVEENATIEDTTEIDTLRAEYKAKFEKDAPVNKKNDPDWIKSKLAE